MAWPDGGRTRWAAALLTLALIGAMAVAFRFWPRPPVELDVEYGESGGRSLRLDIYRPVGWNGPRPAVLLIHGGGWVEGNKASEREDAEGLARAGYVGIPVGYRLARNDATRHPAQVEDVRRAIRWVRANAVSLGVDPRRVGAWGGSAGGHLAAILGTTDVPGSGLDDPEGVSSRADCVVDCSGPTDFTDASNPPLGPDALWMAGNFLGKARDRDPVARRDASPVAHVDARSAPTLIIHGTADDVVPLAQSRKLRDALSQAGVEVKLVEFEGAGHSFAGGDRDLMLAEIMGFLRAHLRP